MTSSLDGQWQLQTGKESGGGGNLRKRLKNQYMLNRKRCMIGQVEEKTTASAAKALIRNMYMRGDVVEYMARKYDIKGEIGIGEKDIRAGKRLP